MNNVKTYKLSMKLLTIAFIIFVVVVGVMVVFIGDINLMELDKLTSRQLDGIKKISIIVGVVTISLFSIAFVKSKKYFEIEDKQLRYIVGNDIVYKWSLEKVQLSYRHIIDRKKSNKFYLKVNDNGKLAEIDCSHLDYKAFYNDLMEIQGREKLGASFSFRDMY